MYTFLSIHSLSLYQRQERRASPVLPKHRTSDIKSISIREEPWTFVVRLQERGCEFPFYNHRIRTGVVRSSSNHGRQRLLHAVQRPRCASECYTIPRILGQTRCAAAHSTHIPLRRPICTPLAVSRDALSQRQTAARHRPIRGQQCHSFEEQIRCTSDSFARTTTRPR